jgi:hypothetical protein
MSHSTHVGFREPQSSVATTARNFRLSSMSTWLLLPLAPDPFASLRVGLGHIDGVATWSWSAIVRPFVRASSAFCGPPVTIDAVGVLQSRIFPPTTSCRACWLNSQPFPSDRPCGVAQNEDSHSSVPGVDGASRNEQRNRLVTSRLERRQYVVEEASSLSSE